MQTARKLRDEFGSDVPKTVDELCSLPGVGPKMAFLCLHVAWKMCGPSATVNISLGTELLPTETLALVLTFTFIG